MFCQNCGNQVDNNTEYCPKCGSKIVKNLDTENMEKVQEIKPKKKKNGKVILVGIVVIAVIGIIIKCMGGIIGNSVLSHYEACPDLEVLCTNMDGNDGYYTICNNGEKTIKDY